VAVSKTRTSIWAAQTLTAGAGNTTSSWIDLSAAEPGSTLSIQLTNGATGPTVAAQVQIQVADNYNAGSPTLPVNFGGPLVGLTTNSGVQSWGGIDLPFGVAAVRLVAGSNTGQNVTVDADISVPTSF